MLNSEAHPQDGNQKLPPLFRLLSVIFFLFPKLSYGDNITFDPIYMDRSDRRLEGLFEISADGTILDGPRTAQHEPVDISYLWKKEILGFLFAQSVLTCVEGIRYCDPLPRRWPTKELSIKVVTERDAIDVEEIGVLVDALSVTLESFGFSTPSTPDIEKARIILYAGSFEYLLHKTEQLSDDYGVQFYQEWKTERGGRFARDDYYEISKPRGTCYVSTKDFAGSGQISIFLQPSDLKKCLPISLMEVAGFSPLAEGYPTLASKDTRYKAATFADRLFAAMLYHPDFPEQPSEASLIAFWQQYIDAVYQDNLPIDKK